jgi:lysozyme family protein
MARFDVCFEQLLDREGRSTKEPAGDLDTSWGVTQPVYNTFRRSRGLPEQDVDLGTPTEFRVIYREYFWNANKCDRLPDPLDAIVFDVAVQSNGAVAGRLLQESLGGLVIDGQIGSKTLMAAAACDPIVTAGRMMKGRINQYIVLALTNPAKYPNLLGWLHRCGKLLLPL